MEQLRKEGYIVYIFTLDKKEYRDLDLDSKFQVGSYPTFILFDKRKEVKRVIGLTTAEWFRKNLKTKKEQDAEQDSNPYDGI